MSNPTPPGTSDQGITPVNPPSQQGITPVNPPSQQGITPVDAPAPKSKKTPLLIGAGVVVAAIIAVIAAIFH